MEKNKDSYIDLERIFKLLWQKKVLIILVSVIFAAIMFIYASTGITPKYQSDVLMYVNNRSISVGSTQIQIASGQISAARELLDTYLVVLQSRTSLDKIIEKADLPYSRAQLKSMISAGSVNNTEVFRVTVTSSDPTEARVIADTVAEVLPEILMKTIAGSSVEIIDFAVMPSQKSSPNVTKYTEIGFVLGFLFICAILVLKEFLDDRIYDESTITQMFPNIPVLADIPHNRSTSSGSYYKKRDYGYGKKKEKAHGEEVNNEQ